MSDDDKALRGLSAAMFTASFGLILYELLLTRLFGVVLFAQFAHLALALALLGISVGAVGQHLWPGLVPAVGQGLRKRVAWLLLAQALLTLLAVACTVGFPVTLQGDAAPLTYQERSGIKDDLLDPFWFAALLPVLTTPFCLAGATFAGVFQRRKDVIGRLYGADLVGGALGAVFFLPLLGGLAGPDVVFVVVGALGACAAYLFRQTAAHRPMLGAVVLAAVSLSVAGVSLAGVEVIRVRHAAGYSEARISYSEWTPLTRLSVHVDDERALILLDNTSASEVMRSKERVQWISDHHSNRALVYKLHRPPARVAILAASAGPDVAVARLNGFTDIEAIDIAGDIFRIVAERFADSPVNPFIPEETRRIKSDGRAAILHSPHDYDIIQMVHANLWSSAGLLSNAWSPSLLETKEAFETYLDRLSDDGTLSFGRGASTDAIVRSAAAALRARGVEQPHRHMLYVDAGSALLLVKKRPWTQVERDKLIELGEPYTRNGKVKVLVDPMAATEPRMLADGEVMTDDRPYLDSKDMVGEHLEQALVHAKGEDEKPLAVLYRSVVIQCAFVLLAGIAFVFVPMLVRRETSRLSGVGLALLYVCCLGYGYLAVETVLIHELVLFVGHPTYAVTAVVLAMLLSSGLGSMWSGGLPEAGVGRTLRRALAVVVVLGLVQAFVVPRALYAVALGWPLGLRIGLTLVLLAPLGFAMGLPFPLAMRRVAPEAAGVVPWAWALNGWMSVVASLSTVLISRIYGYSWAFVAAIVAYGLALVLSGATGRVRMRA